MITVTFQAPNMRKLVEEMSEFLVENTQRVTMAAQGIEGIIKAISPQATEGLFKRGPGRPKKQDPSATAPVPVAEHFIPTQTEIPGPPIEMKTEVTIEPVNASAPYVAPANGAPTLDDIKAVVRKLTEHRPGDKSTHDSIKRAADLLRSFGATSTKELKSEHYAAFLDAARKV